MTPAVLDTSPRRAAWRLAFPPPSPCLFIGESALPPLAGKRVVFIHETDFAPNCPAANFVQWQLARVAEDLGGNREKALTVCERMRDFRNGLPQWLAKERETILLLYSGDSLSAAAAAKMFLAIDTHIGALPLDRVKFLAERLSQRCEPRHLRTVADTCSFSLLAGRNLSDDLAAVRESQELLEALKYEMSDRPGILNPMNREARRKVTNALAGAPLDPEALIYLLPHLQELPL